MDKNRFYSFSVLLLSAVLLAGRGTGTGNAKTGGSLSPSQNPEHPEPLEQLVTPGSTGSGQGIQGEVGGDEFTLVAGGSFDTGSPESGAWRSQDETQHSVTVGDFYLSPYEATQDEYRQVMGANPSSLIGENLPVEMVSWLDAVNYCNICDEKEGLESAYEVGDGTTSRNHSASEYRLPTEAEWEYACRAGTMTPFNTQTSINAEETNYRGDYPYMTGDNCLSQGNLETKSGVYHQIITAVGSFQPNAWGFYDIHGNVGERVWDCYGSCGSTDSENPTGPDSGTRRVNRGGGWNDFAKSLRSAYRAAMPGDNRSYNVGLRLTRNAAVLSGAAVMSESREKEDGGSGRVLIAYFSWRGNTRGITREVERQTGADLFEVEHDLTGKIIIPFCSHEGGRFGQSLTAIVKLAPAAEIRERLAISYSGGGRMLRGVTEWLERNGIDTQQYEAGWREG